MKAVYLIAPLAIFGNGAINAAALECINWQTAHSQWLWCDDFENDASLEQNYFDVNRASGRTGVVSGQNVGGTHAFKNGYQQGQEEAGGVKLSLGSTPVSPKRYTTQKFDELYWRFYMKTESGWVGQPMKVTRATIFSASNWSQAAIGHLWEGNNLAMGLDPASGTSGSSVVTTKWNDFANLKWLGKADGGFQIYASDNVDKWHCVEVHMKLNTPGASDGVMEFWVNGTRQALKENLNFRGSYTGYGINAVTLEGWTNNGAPRTQNRYFDNFVVSQGRIGCLGTEKQPNPPTNVSAQ